MGILTDAVGQGLESLSSKFKERLRSWLAGVLGFGMEVFMDVMSKSYSKKLAPLLDSIESTGKIPPELQPAFDEMKNPTGESAVMLLDKVAGRIAGGALGQIVDAIMLPIAYEINKRTRNLWVGADSILEYAKRVKLDPATRDEWMAMDGYAPKATEILTKLSEFVFPSDIVAQIWLRDKAKYEHLWQDVESLGITGEHLEVLKDLAYKVPGVADVIRFGVREVYSPEIAEKFGQYQDFPAEILKDAEATGLKEADVKKYWAAHWDLPGISQGFDMFHRGLLGNGTPNTGEDTLKTLLRALDVMPYWRDRLIGLSYDLPNRIELRMMARYGLIGKAKLVEILLKGGVDPQYVDLIADMNIAVGLITDLRTRYGNGYIAAEQIKTELAAAGLAPDIQNRLYQYIVKVAKPERTAAEKTATATEIMSAVKKGIISVEEAVQRLMDQNYSQEEALFKLEVYLTTSTGSVHNAGEAKALTDLGRAAHGLPTDRTPQEIVDAMKAVAARYPQAAKLSDEEVKLRVDTTRRKRRRGELTRDQEVTELLAIGIDVSLAMAYAENDDLRLQKGVSE